MSEGESTVDALVRHAERIGDSRANGAANERERVALVLAAAVFVLPAAVLGSHVDLHAVPIVTFLLVTLAYAAASTAEFEVGRAAAVPTEPLLVVMLLLLPPGLVPLSVFAALGLGSAWIRVHGGRSEPLLVTASSAAHAVGPAIVVHVVGRGPLDAGSSRLWVALVVGLAAQVVFDGAVSWLRNCVGLGVDRRELVTMLWWSFRVDVLLGPLGVAAALAFPSGPMAVAVAATPLLLLAMLARDRRDHIDGLIELSTAFHAATDRARRDQLTGLGNRLAWDEAVQQAESDARPAGVVMLDVDWLKRVNDDFGHEAGDHLLRTVARVVDAVCPDDAVVCRLGGDEFGVLLIDGDAAGADQVAAFIRAGLAATPPVCGTAVSASIGTAASAGRASGALRTALQSADRDIYRHKAARGRSRSRPRAQAGRSSSEARSADG